jgi:hypothetical protein
MNDRTKIEIQELKERIVRLEKLAAHGDDPNIKASIRNDVEDLSDRHTQTQKRLDEALAEVSRLGEELTKWQRAADSTATSTAISALIAIGNDLGIAPASPFDAKAHADKIIDAIAKSFNKNPHY